MEPARATWTDERLDDFRRSVDDRFDRVDERFDRVDLELRSLRTELGGRIDALHAGLDALQRTIINVGFAQVAALIGALIALIVTRA